MSKTATNPQTGERVQLINGQWQPIPKATMSERVSNEIKTTAKEKKPVDYDISQSIENFPENAAKVGDDLYNMVTNPYDTITGLGKAVAGGVQKMIPGQADADSWVPNYEPVADAVIQDYADKYGTMDNFKTAAMERPAEVLLDGVGVLGGLGSLPKMGALGQAASVLDPTTLALTGGSKLLMNSPLLRGKPAKMYKEVAKIPTRFDADKVTNIGLDNNMLPFSSGIAKSDDIMMAANDKLTDLIAESGRGGEFVASNSVLRGLDDVKAEVGGFKWNAPEDLATINSEISRFQNYINEQGMDMVSVKELQDFKTDLYKRIDFNRKNQKSTPVDESLRRNVAKNTKETIEDIIPEAKGLNITMGDMLEFGQAMEQPAARLSRNAPFGIGTPLNIMAGEAAGGIPGAGVGATLAILGSAQVKSRIAVGLNKIKKQKITDAKKKVLALQLLRNEASRQAAEDDSGAYGTQ